MGFFRYLTLLFCLCTITLTQAQRYEVDCLVSSEIKAVATDKPTEFDGTRTVLYLRNGTLVNVVGRKVAGTDGQEASHLNQAGDTLDVRQIKAVVEYDGKHYLAEARWLKFSDQNPESATDIFAADNFRPRSRLTDWLNLSHIGLHSAAMRAVYSPILPIVALLLMVAAVWTALRTRFLLLSALPFVASISILVFMALMVDWDALWWCNPDYVGLPKAIGGIIPVALFVALAFCYFFQRDNVCQRLVFGVAYRGGLSGAVANDVAVVASCRERMVCDCGLLWDSDAHQRFPDASVWCCHDSCGYSGSSRACCRACCYGSGFAVDIDGFVYSFPVDWLFCHSRHWQILQCVQAKMGGA